MRASGNLHFYPIIFLLLAAFTSAWPWPNVDSLAVRQDGGGKQSSSVSQSPTPPKTGDSANPTQSGDKEVTTTKGSKGTNTQSDASKTGTQQESSTTNNPPEPTEFDARKPAGGVSMLSPAVLDGPQYYKIGDFVTFAWNYTSLLATPTAVNIVATCTANQQLYTIAANQTVTNSTAAVTWDTNAYQQTDQANPLLTQTYTLIIYDAAGEITATARAGYLAPFNQYTFGMYAKGNYKDLDNGFICATCSGALGDMERRALGMVVGVSILTVLSFTWFVGGTGVIW